MMRVKSRRGQITKSLSRELVTIASTHAQQTFHLLPATNTYVRANQPQILLEAKKGGMEQGGIDETSYGRRVDGQLEG